MEHQFDDRSISEFLQDIDCVSNEVRLPKSRDFLITVLSLPDRVQQYLAKKIDYSTMCRTTPCLLSCQRCGHEVESKWLSRSRMKDLKLDLPFEEVACPVCIKKNHAARWGNAQSKWGPFLDHYNAEVAALNPEPLTHIEHKSLADRFFNGKQDFLNYTWTIRSNYQGVLPLIKRKLVFLGVDDSSFFIRFHSQLAVAPISLEEHKKLLQAWALVFVKEAGENVCRGRSSFTMSEKYLEDITELLNSSSYFELSYSVFRAKKNAIAMAEIESRRRDVTFKHTLRATLEKLVAKDWQVPEGAKFIAEQEVPDAFWRLVRLREHDLTDDQILNYPIGDLALAISDEMDLQ